MSTSDHKSKPTKADKTQSTVEDEIRTVLKKNQFIVPAFEIYGHPAGFHIHGVLGLQLKRKVLEVWRDIFCNPNPDEHTPPVYEIDTPIIGPETMYIASGHVARFTDRVVEDCAHKIERVDHYLKARIRQCSDLDELEKDRIINTLDDMTNDELEDLLSRYGEPERKFGRVYEQNLMMSTNTNLSDAISYMRPETAQGLIVEFSNIYKFNNERLPFGISTIGRVYRKEISPKPFTRLREFEQAEIEMFYDPETKYALPDFMRNTVVNVFSSSDQSSGDIYDSTRSQRTLGKMVESVSLNGYIALFMYKIIQFCKRIGLDTNRIRFRQHLKNELAHYSSDCWDMEYLVRDRSTEKDTVHPEEKNWIEVIGVANRGDYDLLQHNNAHSMKVKRYYSQPVERIVYAVRPDMKAISKIYGKETNNIREYLMNELKTDHSLMDIIIYNNKCCQKTVLKISDKSYVFEHDMIRIEKEIKRITSDEFIPHIIEPSFGVDRLLYALLNSSYWVRNQDTDNNSQTNTDTDTDVLERSVLSFADNIAPITVAVLPLYTKDIMMKYVPRIVDRIRKVRPDFMIRVDTSSASIGKRYARVDEIGVPYAITIDYQTDTDDAVTVRERDTMNQIRVPIDRLFEH